MKWELFVALRYLTGRRKEKFISVISLISILGITIGVGALIIVIAVMSGFDNDLKDKIIGIHSHMVAESDYGIKNIDDVMNKIEDVPHVVATSPYVHGQVILKSKDDVMGIILRGVDPDRELRVNKFGSYITRGDLDLKKDGIVIGSELARKLKVKLNDSVSIISHALVKGQSLRVCGIFKSGMYDYDLNLAYVHIKRAQQIFGIGDLASGISIKTDNAFNAVSAKRNIQKVLRYPYAVRTWMDSNKNLLSALKLEKTVMFLIVTLIVMVACFNIASTLIMTVLEKTKDIGILKSIGATNGSVMRIFTIEGCIIGLIGTTLGTIFGVASSWMLKTYKFIALPKDVYYIDRLPVNLQWQDVSIIIVASLALSLLATIYPSYQASRLDPVEALRYE